VVIKSSAPLEISTTGVRQAAWPYVYAFSSPGTNVRICNQGGLGYYGTGRPAATFPLVMAYPGLDGPSGPVRPGRGTSSQTPQCVA
jgi:hypothetical protein